MQIKIMILFLGTAFMLMVLSPTILVLLDRTLKQLGMKDHTNTSVIATWDDHEVDNNWSYDEVLGTILVCTECLSKCTSTKYRSRWFHLEKITMGKNVGSGFGLSFRTSKQQLYPTEQMEWLKEGLRTSKSQWKIILNSVPITNMEDLLGAAISDDRWQGYPESRTDILTFIEEEEIKNVLWVSGDFHYGMVAKTSRAGDAGHNMYEVLTGPTGSGPSPLGHSVPTDQYLYGHSTWCHTRFTVDPAQKSVLVSFVGDDGVVFSEYTIT